MGLKVNMERAYYRMSCDFVELMLMKFCFQEQFITSIMDRVREPSFPILINGSPT